MKKFTLNFICKNESHIILEMLQSALPLTDLIVAVDTGSEDNTISVIQEFGRRNNIPTYLYLRPFDNFGNSRNFALDQVKQVVRELNWPLESTWAFFIDCDEILEFNGAFSKHDIGSDIYFIGLTEGDILCKRNFMINLAKDFRWEGPIHEYISIPDQTVSADYINEARIVARSLGASWKGNIEDKYLQYAGKLIEYVNDGHKNFRWLRFIGESYSTAALATPSKERAKRWFLEAERYYQAALSADPKEHHARYVLYDRLAETKSSLGRKWSNIREDFLNAHAADPRHGEPFLGVIKEYVRQRRIEQAYLYSSFAVSEYHGRVPTGFDMGHIQTSVYTWELLFYHLLICTSSGRIVESKRYYDQLRKILKDKLLRFNIKELIAIRMLLLQNRVRRALNFKKIH
ncbi:MAG TPA: glycosyltransferase family 2 protein [Puia sp.]|nr:glycosyltransferase family 2 protein [Puia sp.]